MGVPGTVSLGRSSRPYTSAPGYRSSFRPSSSPEQSIPLDSMPIKGFALILMPPGSVEPSRAAGVCIPAYTLAAPVEI